MRQVSSTIKTPKTLFTMIALFFCQFLMWAQDEKKVDVTLSVDKGESQWYTEPWMWVVGGAIFIIIIVAILSGRGGKD